MGWNYRVIRIEEQGEPVYAIHEVFYDQAGKINGWTKEPVNVVSDDRLGLLYVLTKMVEAEGQPVLEEIAGSLIEVEPRRIQTDELANCIQSVMDAYPERFGLKP
jgi:hypothetical protein